MTIIVSLDKLEAESLASCANTLEARAKIHEAVKAVREAEQAFGPTVQQQPSPYQLQQNFIVPLLCVEEDGDLFVFESTFLLEHPWRLGQKDAKLSENYNPLKRPTGKAGLVDVNAANQVTAGLMAMEEGEDFVGTLHQQVMELGGSSDWSVEMLVGWLLPESSLVVTETKTINFVTMSYEPGWNYEGGFQFKKHYFGPKPGELKEKRADGKLTEEFRCAQFLDGLAEVKFWVRNLSRRTTSFRLQTATDWFYPDFICLLHDGRVLAVEYKGGHLSGNDDSGEKRAVGEVWKSRSKGKCLFIMPVGTDLEAIQKKVSSS